MLTEEEVRRRRAELEERRAWRRRYRRRQIIFIPCFCSWHNPYALHSPLHLLPPGYRHPGDGAEDGRLLVLFLGTDDVLEASTRADTIMLLSVDTDSGDVGVLSIPRDTRVWSPSRQSWDRINALYAHGGTKLVLEAVSQLVGVPVRYYVHTDFRGFQELVDILGGVELTVPKRMYYVDKAQGLRSICSRAGRSWMEPRPCSLCATGTA